MTVDSLIEHLQMLKTGGLSGTAVVKAYDGNSERLETVTGFLYDNATVELCTDTMNE